MFMLQRGLLMVLTGILASGLFPSATAAEAGHHRAVETLRFSSDARMLASGAADGTVMLWDTQTGERSAVLEAHRLPVDGLAFSHDGNTLITAGWDGTAKVWNLAKRQVRMTLSGHDGAIHAVALSPDGKRVATAGLDRTVRLWDLESGEQVAETKLDDPVPNDLDFNSTGTRLAVGTRTTKAFVWNVPDWRRFSAFEVGARANTVRFTADDQLLVGGSAIESWDVDENKKLDEFTDKQLEGPFDQSRDDAVLAAITRQGAAIWREEERGEPLRVDQFAGQPQSLAVAPDGSMIAVGGKSGKIELFEVEDGTRRHVMEAVPARNAAVTPTPPDGAPKSLAGINLLAEDGGRELWHHRNDTQALTWEAKGGNDDDTAGLHFEAAAIPTHLVGKDHLVTATGLGTRPFELKWEVRIDTKAGHPLFHCGLAVGLASAPLGKATEEDIAAAVSLHFAGIYAGVRKGEPYALVHGGSNVSTDSHTQLTDSGPVPAIPWADELNGLVATDRTLRVGIRRDGLNVLTFVLWSEDLGQTAENPWWSGTWQMPEELAEKPLEYLFVKRVPIPSVHLGAQAVGYDDIMLLSGTLQDMRLHLDPPAIDEVDWPEAVLKPGNALTIRGAGFTENARVLIGGKPATDVQMIDNGELRATVPPLDGGQRYDAELALANGLNTIAKRAVPIGRLVEEASLLTWAPDGDQELTLRGAGFDDRTRVFFGDTEAEISERIDRAAVRVRIPPGQHGPAPITARVGDGVGDGDEFAGQAPFAYAKRPFLWFDAAAREQWRERSQQEPLAAHRKQILSKAENSFGRLTLNHGGPGGRPAALVWAWTLNEEPRYAQGALKWVKLILDKNSHDKWRNHDRIVATVLDLAGERMDDSLRSNSQQYLMETLDRWLADEAKGDWMVTSINSTNPSANLAAVMSALLLEDVRDDSEQIIEKAKGHMIRYIEGSFAPTGGTRETLFWALQGFNRYLEAAHLLARHRNDRTMLEHPRLEKIGQMFQIVVAQPKRIMNFNDSQPLPGWITSVTSELGTRFDDGLMQWLADDTLPKAGAKQAAMAMLWRSDQPFPAPAPSVPTAGALPTVEWGIMRNRPAVDAELVVGLKGHYGPMSYRYHRDVGSFVLYGHDEPLLIDPGWGKKAPDQHTLSVVDGFSNDGTGGIITNTFASDSWRALVIDLNHAYAPHGIERVRRTLLMHGDEHVIVLDDIDAGDELPGETVSWWQIRSNKLELDRQSLQARADSASLTTRFFGPKAKLNSRRRGTFHGAEWHSVEAAYTADPEQPLVTVLRVTEDDETAPAEADVNYGKERITVTLPGDVSASFQRTSAGWGFVRPNGEDTEILLSEPAPFRRPQGQAVHVETPPTLDGQLDDPAWQEAKPLTGFSVKDTWNTDEREAEHPTEVRLAWDVDNLYLAFRCYEPNLEGLHTSMIGPAQNADNEDYVAIYLDPDRHRGPQPYYGRQITAEGDHLGRYGASGDLGRPEMTSVAGRETDGEQPAWTLEVALPWKSVLHDPWNRLETTAPPQPGVRMGLNLLRHRAQTPAETTTWAESWRAAHQTPWRWGTLLLEPKDK